MILATEPISQMVYNHFVLLVIVALVLISAARGKDLI